MLYLLTYLNKTYSVDKV